MRSKQAGSQEAARQSWWEGDSGGEGDPGILRLVICVLGKANTAARTSLGLVRGGWGGFCYP